MRRRKHISTKTKLAAALGCLLSVDELMAMRARKAPVQAILSRFDWHHIQLHAWGGGDAWWNLHPMLREEHKTQTKKDIAAHAKSNRIRMALAGSTRKTRAIPSRGFNKTLRRK